MTAARVRLRGWAEKEGAGRSRAYTASWRSRSLCVSSAELVAAELPTAAMPPCAAGRSQRAIHSSSSSRAVRGGSRCPRATTAGAAMTRSTPDSGAGFSPQQPRAQPHRRPGVHALRAIHTSDWQVLLRADVRLRARSPRRDRLAMSPFAARRSGPRRRATRTRLRSHAAGAPSAPGGGPAATSRRQSSTAPRRSPRSPLRRRRTRSSRYPTTPSRGASSAAHGQGAVSAVVARRRPMDRHSRGRRRRASRTRLQPSRQICDAPPRPQRTRTFATTRDGSR